MKHAVSLLILVCAASVMAGALGQTALDALDYPLLLAVIAVIAWTVARRSKH